MLWHRRPTQPRLDATILNQIEESFLFNHCVHITGALCLLDETNLCKECYNGLRTNIIRQQYRPLRRHFFVNSHIVRNDFCSACGAKVIEVQPLDKCISCTLTAHEFLELLHNTSTSVNSHNYPLVLNVYDRTPT